MQGGIIEKEEGAAVNHAVHALSSERFYFVNSEVMRSFSFDCVRLTPAAPHSCYLFVLFSSHFARSIQLAAKRTAIAKKFPKK